MSCRVNQDQIYMSEDKHWHNLKIEWHTTVNKNFLLHFCRSQWPTCQKNALGRGGPNGRSAISPVPWLSLHQMVKSILIQNLMFPRTLYLCSTSWLKSKLESKTVILAKWEGWCIFINQQWNHHTLDYHMRVQEKVLLCLKISETTTCTIAWIQINMFPLEKNHPLRTIIPPFFSILSSC